MTANPNSVPVDDQNHSGPSSEHVAIANHMVPVPYQHPQTNILSHRYALDINHEDESFTDNAMISTPPAPAPLAVPYSNPRSTYAAPPSSIYRNTAANLTPSHLSGSPRQAQTHQKERMVYGSPMDNTGRGSTRGAQNLERQSSGTLGQDRIGSSPPLFADTPMHKQVPTENPANRALMMHPQVAETQPQPQALAIGTSQPQAPTPLPPPVLLAYNDVLKPIFHWMPQQARASTNDEVGRLHVILSDENMVQSLRRGAFAKLAAISKRVMEGLANA